MEENNLRKGTDKMRLSSRRGEIWRENTFIEEGSRFSCGRGGFGSWVKEEVLKKKG